MNRILEDIKNGTFARVYLLYGDEAYLKRYYRNVLRKALVPEDDTINFNQFSGKDLKVEELMEQAMTMPFFAEHRLIMVTDSELFKNKEPGEKLADFLANVPAETVIVFSESQVDTRKKLFKAVKELGVVEEYKHPDRRSIGAWVVKALARDKQQIAQNALDAFLDSVGEDMEKASHELGKVSAYTMGKAMVTLEDVQALCIPDIGTKVFDLNRSIFGGQSKKALQQYYELLELQEKPLGILYWISRQLNEMMIVLDLRVQSYDVTTIAKKTGLRDFAVKNYLRYVGNFPSEKVRRAVEECVKTEEAVKSGRIGDEEAVEMLIIKCSK